jgi:glycerol-3-phosphate dehydrogenase
MKRFIDTYDGDPFEVIIIGGGITGAAVAYDAASRGLSVALLEKQDFGCATSAATSKLIHGGLRYLAYLEFGLVRESLRERRILCNIAPNFVYPQPVLITSYDTRFAGGLRGLRAGLMIYHALAFDKGCTWDSSKRIPGHKILSPREVLSREPNIRTDNLIGGALYSDCASLCPERLTLAFVKSALKEGAQAANYAKVEGFLFSKTGKIAGVKVRNLMSGRDLVDIRGSLVVNCGGPWADLILGLIDGSSAGKKLRRSEGIHLITKKLVTNHIVSCANRKGSYFSLVPWRGHTLIGTTDKEYLGDPDDYRVTRIEIEELLDDVNQAFGQKPLKYQDVLFAYGGLRPLVADRTKGSYESSRKYEIYDHARDGFDGLITVEGGKYTTSRNLAEKVVKTVARKLGRNLGQCTTAKRRLAGCEIPDLNRFMDGLKKEIRDLPENTLDWLGRHYGTEYQNLVHLARSDQSLAEPLDADGEIAAQVIYAIDREMAMTLKDIFFRRTGLGTLGPPRDGIIDRVADMAAARLGWDEPRRLAEISQVTRALKLPE